MSVFIADSSAPDASSHNTGNTGIACSDCGSAMNEVSRSDEGAMRYVWLECSRDDCAGIYLIRQQVNR